jgi:hypothetical protein
MTQSLFNDRLRTDSAPKSYGESVFEFYNRVDRPEWARVRDELDDWYSEYPDDGRDLRNRFRNPGVDQHFGAWLALSLSGLSQFFRIETISLGSAVLQGSPAGSYQKLPQSGLLVIV